MDQWAALAESGDTEVARRLIKQVGIALSRGRLDLAPESARAFIGRALIAIAADADPGIALGLKPPKHKQRPPDYWKMVRDADMALAVKRLMQDEALSLDDAAERVGNEYRAFAEWAGKVGFEAAKKAYLRFCSEPKCQGKP
jgi:hypothetical protein